MSLDRLPLAADWPRWGVQAVEGVRLHRQQRQSAALRLQVAWYTYKKQFPTFLLLSGLRDQDRHDAEMVANVRRR